MYYIPTESQFYWNNKVCIICDKYIRFGLLKKWERERVCVWISCKVFVDHKWMINIWLVDLFQQKLLQRAGEGASTHTITSQTLSRSHIIIYAKIQHIKYIFFCAWTENGSMGVSAVCVLRFIDSQAFYGSSENYLCYYNIPIHTSSS